MRRMLQGVMIGVALLGLVQVPWAQETRNTGTSVPIYPNARVVDSSQTEARTAAGDPVRTVLVELETADDADRVAAYYELHLRGAERSETSRGENKTVVLAPEGAVPGLAGAHSDTRVIIQEQSAGPTRVRIVRDLELAERSR